MGLFCRIFFYYRALLLKRPMILSILPTEATPYQALILKHYQFISNSAGVRAYTQKITFSPHGRNAYDIGMIAEQNNVRCARICHLVVIQSWCLNFSGSTCLHAKKYRHKCSLFGRNMRNIRSCAEPKRMGAVYVFANGK